MFDPVGSLLNMAGQGEAWAGLQACGLGHIWLSGAVP